MIAATGFRPGLEPVLGHLGVLDTDGAPRVSGEVEAAPGLRFVGYRPRPAHIAYMGGEAAPRREGHRAAAGRDRLSRG